jgi:hypothetical protein
VTCRVASGEIRTGYYFLFKDRVKKLPKILTSCLADSYNKRNPFFKSPYVKIFTREFLVFWYGFIPVFKYK